MAGGRGDGATVRARKSASRAERPAPGSLGHGDLATSLILVFPLFLAYQIAAVYAESINGVDVVTRSVLAAVDYDRASYLVILFVLAVGFLLALALAHRHRAASRASLVPVLFESAIYALTLGSFIVLVMEELLGFRLSGAAQLAYGAAGEALVIALGAGVHEELVFRLGVMAGVATLLSRLGMYHRPAMAVALAASAALFSLAHHLGPHGEEFRLDVFTYRALAGAVFGLVFYYRSLAHAVYTHFLYDAYVLLLRP